MTIASLKKFVLPPVVISAAVFSVLTLPLAVLGSKPVDIQLQGEPVFDGPLREMASPYLGLAGALSMGAGIASVALLGWQQSSRKHAVAEQQLSGLQQHLQEKEELLLALRLSESNLEASELNNFLNDQTSVAVAVAQTAASRANTTAAEYVEPVFVEMPLQVVEPLVIGQSLEPQVVQPSPSTVQAAASVFASAQPFLGYAQANSSSIKSTEIEAEVPVAASVAPLLIEELQSQLRQIVAQMENWQSALKTTQQAVLPDTKAQANFNSDAHPSHQLQVISQWTPEKIAS